MLRRFCWYRYRNFTFSLVAHRPLLCSAFYNPHAYALCKMTVQHKFYIIYLLPSEVKSAVFAVEYASTLNGKSYVAAAAKRGKIWTCLAFVAVFALGSKKRLRQEIQVGIVLHMAMTKIHRSTLKSIAAGWNHCWRSTLNILRGLGSIIYRQLVVENLVQHIPSLHKIGVSLIPSWEFGYPEELLSILWNGCNRYQKKLHWSG